MSIESRNLVKEILTRMNTGKFDLDNFYETIEKETGGKLTFTNFKNYLDSHYENISKCILNLKLSYKIPTFFLKKSIRHSAFSLFISFIIGMPIGRKILYK